MISLVIVSHCHQIAEGVKELAMQMTREPVNIVPIGGIVDDSGQRQLGTDAVQIATAIHDKWTGDGILILVDLGSAVLSAETALELLPEEMQLIPPEELRKRITANQARRDEINEQIKELSAKRARFASRCSRWSRSLPATATRPPILSAGPRWLC